VTATMATMRALVKCILDGWMVGWAWEAEC
jgi:hypothetical protein